MRLLHLSIIVILGFSILFVTGQAYAPCIAGPEMNCNDYPPPSLAQIKFDKLNYETSDKPIITIIGAPDAVAHLEIDDSSSNIMYAHDINLAPNGTVIYTLDISDYKPGVYSVIATSPISKLTTGFTVDLMPTGGHIFLNVDKSSYIPRDHVIILGTMNSNTLVQLSLINPNGIPVESTQTFSDNTGHFSLSNFTIPTNAISGVWKIGATRGGVEHTQIPITVNSTLGSNSNIKMDVATLSPLKQFKSGIVEKDVQCNSGLQLIVKAEDGSPACVNVDTIIPLTLRGWASESLDREMMYLMKSNSTAQIFVKFTSNRFNGPGPAQPLSINPRFYAQGTSPEYSTDAINATVTPHSVYLGSTTIVTYTITSQNTPSGIYWLSVGDSCGAIPIVINLESSQVTTSNLQSPTAALNCPVPLLQYQIVGVTGATTEFVSDKSLQP